MGKKRKRDNSHVSDEDFTDGQLERNATYKEDAYDRMCGIPHLKNSGSTLSALTDRENAMLRKKNRGKSKGRRLTVQAYRNRYTKGKSPTERTPMYLIGYTDPKTKMRNFGHRSTKLEVLAAKRAAEATLRAASSGSVKRARLAEVKQEAEDAYRALNPDPLFESKLPYPHNAHHIIPVATFHEASWYNAPKNIIGIYRLFLAASEYDINAPENIIYLPQPYSDPWICKIHGLPNHASGHNLYNEAVVDKCDEVYDLIEEAVEETDCEAQKDFLQDIYDLMIQIQTEIDNALQAAGPVPIGSVL